MKRIFAVAAIIAGSHAFAQEDSSRSLNEVVVTATKYPTKQSNTGKVVGVVTRTQIERSAGRDLAQVLNEQTGVTVNGSWSNPGKDKSVFLRGAGTGYTLFLLDGIPLNDPSGTGGTYDIRLIPLESIERIEILKGSQSTLYGSNAIAGVVNIITRKPESGRPSASALLSYGSYHTLRGNAAVSGKARAVDYQLSYDYYDTEGLSEARDLTGSGNFDRDGFNRHSVNATLGVQATEKIRLAPYFRLSDFSGAYDREAFIDGPHRYQASLLNTGLTGTVNYSRGTLTLLYGYDHTRRDYAGTPFEGMFHHAEVYVNHRLGSRLQLLGGLNYQAYGMEAPDTTNTLFSPYASLFYQSGSGLNVEVGGRFNHHNRYGNNFTYSFNPSWLANNRLKFFANLSTGFRAPAISELFGPYGANPDLAPEESRSIEGGVQAWAAGNRLSLLATYFDRDIKNVIIYEWPAGYRNRDRQKDHGVEAELIFVPSKAWNLKAAYTYVDGSLTQKLPGKDTTFYNLLRRPKHTVQLTAGWQATTALFLSASLQAFGEREDVYYNPANFWAAEPKTLEAYTLLNLYTEYRLRPFLTLFADARNLTDRDDHYEVYGYNVQGFNLSGGIRFQF